jgi:superfamily II DNA or RNA helicase
MFTVDEISKKYNLKDKGRLERQFDLYNKWKQGDKSKGIRMGYSSILGATGSGKSTLGLLACLENHMKNRKSKIILPTSILVDEWKEKVNWWGLSDSVTCHTVQSLTINKNPSQFACDLLILDEEHRYSSKHFKRVFEIQHKWCMGLTATLPEDEQYAILTIKLPIIDQIDLEEALRENYVSDFIIYNYPIIATPREAYMMDQWRISFWKHVNIVGDFKNATRAMSDKDFRQSLAWEKKVDESAIFGAAKAMLNTVQERQKFFYNNDRKKDRLVEIVNHYQNSNIITFARSIDFAESCTEMLGDIAACYHSKMKKTDKAKVMTRFKHHRGKIRVVLSALALVQGVDIPKVDIGINSSWTSSSVTFMQELGRTLRLHKSKDKARFFNTPIIRADGKKTQDEKWLESAMKLLPINKIKIINELTDEI